MKDAPTWEPVPSSEELEKTLGRALNYRREIIDLVMAGETITRFITKKQEVELLTYVKLVSCEVASDSSIETAMLAIWKKGLKIIGIEL